MVYPPKYVISSAFQVSIPYKKDLALEYNKNSGEEDQSKVPEDGLDKNADVQQKQSIRCLFLPTHFVSAIILDTFLCCDCIKLVFLDVLPNYIS